MAAMTLLNQDHVVAGSVAPAVRWSAIDGDPRHREHALIGYATKTATTEVKPFYGNARRPSEGSS